VRAGDPALPARSQDSLAVSADGRRWSILGASPDLRDQLADFPGLHPRPGTRDLPLDTVVLANAELDHALGLLVLREALSYRILSTRWVRDALLEHNAVFRPLEPIWGTTPLDRPLALDAQRCLEARLFPVPGRVPGWLRDLAKPHAESSVAIRVTDAHSRRRLVYAPAVRELDPGTLAELEAADCRLVDGTFYTARELSDLRPGAPDAFAMGHAPITGPGGTLALLAGLPGRTFYCHVNGTNPILDPKSEAAAAVRAAGIDVAFDGQELEL
jgi:pyrroloquinoline quinone biosynthesis protein B